MVHDEPQNPQSRWDLASLQAQLTKHNGQLLGFAEARRTVVLVTLQEQEGDYRILFERRAKTLRRQPGEISFPGGHVEQSDKTLAEAAVRETAEELGIPQGCITVIGQLDTLVASTNLLVYPFVGYLDPDVKLKPNSSEVDDVLSVSVTELLDHVPRVYEVGETPVFPKDFPFQLIPGGSAYPWRTSTHTHYFYVFPHFVVWGLTARVLHHFLELWSAQ